MKKIVFILIHLAISVVSIAQSNKTVGTFQIDKPAKFNYAVESPKINVMYYGVDNPIFIMPSCNYRIDSVAVLNGEITGTNGEYIVKIPNRKDSCTLCIYSKNKATRKMEVMEKRSFRILNVPDPMASICGKRGFSFVSKEELLNSCTKVTAELYYFLYDLKFDILSFDVIIKHKDQSVNYKSKSDKVPKNISDAFKNIEKGDEVIFENILCKSQYNQEIRMLASIKLKINSN